MWTVGICEEVPLDGWKVMTTQNESGTDSKDGTQSCDSQVRLLNLHRACKYIGLSYWTVREMISRGELSFVRVGRRILIDRQDLDHWIEEKKEQWR